MPLPDLAALRLLADVARLGSIGAAGRASGISQQSASERLRAMEAEVGLVLLRRQARGSSLTEAGRLLVEWSVALLRQADEVETALATLRGDGTRELRVHASMTTAEFLLPAWLVALRRVAPERAAGVSVRATNSRAVLAAVRAGEADLGFIEGPARPHALDGMSHRAVGTDELVLAAAPADPWARRGSPITPALVARRPLTSREPGSGARAVVEGALASAGVVAAPPEVELTTNAAVLAAVRAGGAPGFVSRRAAALDLAAGSLVAVPTRGLDLTRALTAVWVGGSRPPAGPVRDLLAIAARDGALD